MTTGSVIWRWNETDLSQFGGQLDIGPVTGTVTLSVKQPTGSFSVRPTIRATLSPGFRTPSGSIVLFPINNLITPKNFRVRFIPNHFETIPNLSTTASVGTRLKFGILGNASSGTVRSDYCGTFYSTPFFSDLISQPLPLNGGFQNSDNNTTWSNDFRTGLVSSSYCIQDWSFKHLSITGSSINGADFEALVESIKDTSANVNEVSYTTFASSKSQNYSNIHWSGSLFSGKILNRAYLAFYYNPAAPAAAYVPLTSAYIEFDSLQFLAHNDGDGVELQPPPLTTSFSSGSLQPSSFSSSLTYWSFPTGTTITVSGPSVTAFSRFSGSNQTFGNVAGSSPLTGTLIINNFTASTLFFSGANNRLSSSTTHAAYISGSAFRNFYVVNILTASANSATRYSNHAIHGDTSGWWGVFFRNNGNGSGSIDLYGWVTSQVTANFEFKYGTPMMIEYWRDTTTLYGRMNNTGSIFSSSAIGNIPVASGNPSNLGSTVLGCQFHLLEMITSNSNTVESGEVQGIGNYLAQKYGFPIRSGTVAIGGENW